MYINSVNTPKNTPRLNIFNDIINIDFLDAEVPLFLLERIIETPTINMKKG